MRGATGRYWAHNMGFDDFNPRSPCGERHHYVNGKSSPNEISTHAPHAGSDEAKPQLLERMSISTHAPHAGSDPVFEKSIHADADFNPRSPCGERLLNPIFFVTAEGISTHAPHAGSDVPFRCSYHWYLLFQPTLPMRGATGLMRHLRACREFQPTLPMRGATHQRSIGAASWGISTHAPHAGSDSVLSLVPSMETISTHAPHAGSDDLRSARVHERRISTHAPHAGSDWVSIDKIERQFNFNPRSPCGERPAWYRASSL